MEFLSAIYGIIKAIPIIDSWFKQIVAMYFAKEVASQNREFTDAMIVMIRDKDQRAFEKAIGSSNAGKPSTDQTNVEDVSAGDFEKL